jgi:hypothetical protein
MTACLRAAEGHQAPATSADTWVQPGRPLGKSIVACKKSVVLFLSDVLDGLRRVSHSALAMLGLAAVLSGVFLLERPEVRHDLEGQALGWLMARAHAQTASVEADVPTDNGVLLAMAEPDAIQRATATNPADLNRQQANVAYWIARRYNVAPEPISRLVQEAWVVGERVGMEPTLVLAVMAVESGFNPFAQSHVGAQGLMQVMTRIHHDKYAIFGGQNAAFDPVTNLRVGVQVLKDCIRKAGSLEGGLKYYVGAANMVDDGGYATKVLAEQAYLRQVAAGHKLAPNAPLPQAVVAQAGVTSPALPAGLPTAVPVSAVPASAVNASPAAPAASETAPVAPPTHRPEQVAMLTP